MGDDVKKQKKWINLKGWWWKFPLFGIGAVLLINSISGGAKGLPDCASSDAKSSVKNAMKNAPLGRVMGLDIIEFKNVQTDSKSDALIQCRADVTLNNATTHPIRYKFEIRNKQIYVEANVLGL